MSTESLPPAASPAAFPAKGEGAGGKVKYPVNLPKTTFPMKANLVQN